MTKLFRAALGTAAFFILLFVVYFVHVRFARVDVVLYAALSDAAIAAAIAGLAISTMRHFSVFNGFEKAQMVLIWALAGYAFAISVPTVIDRSLSFYLLEKLQQRGGAIPLASFDEVFTKEYVREHRLVDVRLTEQLESGTILIDEGCVRLTARGDRLARFSRFFRRTLLPKQRLLMGEYSDALTDPFRDGSPAHDYGCGDASPDRQGATFMRGKETTP